MHELRVEDGGGSLIKINFLVVIPSHAHLIGFHIVHIRGGTGIVAKIQIHFYPKFYTVKKIVNLPYNTNR